LDFASCHAAWPGVAANNAAAPARRYFNIDFNPPRKRDDSSWLAAVRNLSKHSVADLMCL
jgi:hypothetical protein